MVAKLLIVINFPEAFTRQRNESEVRARHYQLPGCIPQYAIDFYRELESPSVIRQFVELGRE